MGEFQRGDRVVRIVDGAVGVARESRDGHTRVFFSRGDEPWILTANLASADCDWRVFERKDLVRHLLALKYEKPLEDNFYATNANRARFEVHQFKPALKFFDNDRQRMLIADEVGLGKTIEAGIIFQELNARNPAALERVLVICPSGLKEKWHQELLSRFGEDFVVASSSELVRRIGLFQNHGQHRFKMIVPLETVRVDPARSRLEEAIDEGLDFDLTIIDEAHHLRNPETGSHQIAESIADASAHLLLLTATPVQLGSEDLYNILSLFDRTLFPNIHVFNDVIEPNRFVNDLVAALSRADWNQAKRALAEVQGWRRTSHFRDSPFLPRVERFLEQPTSEPRQLLQAVRDAKELHTLSPLITRTRKREVMQATATRQSQVLRVALTAEEKAYYEAVKEYARSLVSGSSWNASAFAVIARERQAASCIPASVEYFSESAGGRAVLGVDGWFTEASPGERADAPAGLRRLLDLGRACTRDSKYEMFRDALRLTLEDAPDKKVLVFSFFKRTLGYLEKRLRRDGIDTLVISGDVETGERARRIRRFKDGKCQVMLSSEVGAEGLDFQFCSALFNYDLPWNPMRVEQRIGRLDRYGQTSPVVAITSLFLKETIEERILLRLYERIGVFEETIGELEPILGNVVAQLERELFTAQLRPDQETALARRIELAIENRRLESEIFSQRMDEFLGNDDLIAQVEDRRDRGLTTEAEDILETVQYAASTARTRIEPVAAHAGVYLLRRSPDLADAIHRVARASRLQMTDEQQNLLTLIRSEDRWVIFDGDVATKYADVAFLGTAHPVTRWAIQMSLDELAQMDKSPVYRVKFNADRRGVGFLFLFRYLQHAAKSGARLHPFYWRDGDWAPHDEAWEIFGRLRLSGPSALPLDDAEFELLDEEVFGRAAALRSDVLEELQTRNDAVLAARNASIERLLRAKLSAAERRLERAGDVRIRRMLDARVRNLRGELENHRIRAGGTEPVDVAYEPVMRVMVEFGPANSSRVCPP